MELDRPLPNPITPEARPYWDGLKEHKLMLPTCNNCRHSFFYPRVRCPRCHSRDIQWVRASGNGTLHSFAIAHQSLNRAFKIPPPFVLAMVQLDEGPRIMSNLVNIAPDPKVVKCDMLVEAVFVRLTDDVTLPLFQPRR
jgi:uncharacterized OB-fold protein